MEYNDILQILAPCGLNCKKCMIYINGDIKFHSNSLKKLLGSFDNYANRFSKFWSIFVNYPKFKELLDYFAEGNCSGCRKGDCYYPDCGIAKCYKDKNVDFCFKCDEFPCNKSNLDDDLKTRWIKMNNRMKEIGIKEYYKETKDDPRYT
jgi:hypothetical protein